MLSDISVVFFIEYCLIIFLFQDIDCMPLNPLENMPASLIKHSTVVNKFFENVSELKMKGEPKDRKTTEYGKISSSENVENVDGPSRLSPSNYSTNNLLKQAKVSWISPLKSDCMHIRFS